MNNIYYMDKVDFDYELGEALGGSKVYIDEQDLRNHQPCVESCGIVTVKVTLHEVIKYSDFESRCERTNSREHERNKIEAKRTAIDRLKERIVLLEKEIEEIEKTDNEWVKISDLIPESKKEAFKERVKQFIEREDEI